MPVATVAAEVGYGDPYYFSRMFSRTTGISPRGHVNRVKRNRNGGLLAFDEPEQQRLMNVDS
jgi:AraC-like DNA-binding protein